MHIWIDADACPKVIKEILFRAAERTQTSLILVSNHEIFIPYSSFISKVRVESGFDVADNKIVESMQPGDLVITADIPLADAVIKKGSLALDPRGRLYSEENIKQRLVMRHLMEQLRDSGTITGGPTSFSQQDRRAFANQLDRLITDYKKKLA